MRLRLIAAIASSVASMSAGAAEPAEGPTALQCARAFDANSGRMHKDSLATTSELNNS